MKLAKQHIKLIFYFTFFLCSPVQCKASITNLCQKWLIEDINEGHYYKVVNDLNYCYLEDWSFSSSLSARLRPEKAMDFINYIDTIDIPQEKKDGIIYFIASGIQVIATDLTNIRHYQEAIEYTELALKIIKIIPQKDIDCAVLLSNLGKLYDFINKDSVSLLYYNKAIELYHNTHNDDHPFYAVLLHNMSNLYRKKYDYEYAEHCLLQALNILNKSSYDLNVYKTIVLNDLGNLYNELYDSSGEEKSLLNALDIYNNSSDTLQPDFWIFLNNLGQLYKRKKEYTKSKNFLLKALDLCIKTNNTQHLDFAKLLCNIGDLYIQTKNLYQAGDYYKQANEIFLSNSVDTLPDYAIVLNGLAKIYMNYGDYQKSEDCYLQIKQLTNPINHKDKESRETYYQSIYDLSMLYGKIGNFSKAEEYLHLYEQYISQLITSQNNSTRAITWDNIGNLYRQIGNYKMAEKNFMKAQNWYTMHPTTDSQVDYAINQNNIGLFWWEIGDYQKAEKSYLQAKEIIKSRINECPILYCSILNNLGLLFAETARVPEAKEYYQNALNIGKNLLDNRERYLMILHNLVSLYIDDTDYEQAESYITEMTDIIDSVEIASIEEKLAYITNIGRFYKKCKNSLQSEHYYTKAIEQIPFINSTKFWTASLYENLGVYYTDANQYNQAEQYMISSSIIFKNVYLQSLNFMTERERNNFWNKMEFQVSFKDVYPTYSYYSYANRNHNISQFAYDNELFRKGLLLSSFNLVKYSILNSNDERLIFQWETLRMLKQCMMAMQDSQQQSENIQTYTHQADSLEKVITLKSSIYREHKRLWSITWDSIRNVLKQNQVAIEYMSAPINEDSTMYCALLLRDTCSFPIMIPLFEEKEVVSLLNTTSTDSTRINSAFTYNENGKLLTQYIWNKVKRYIKEGDMVYFAPTGLLHQIPIENLPYDSTRTIGDVYNMVRLSSTRDLVLRKQSIIPTNAVLYGGINYNATPEDLAVDHAKYDKPSIPSYVALAVRNFRDGWADPLPGTEIEVKEIQKVLSEANIDVQCDTAEVATEEAFKALSGAHKNIIHLATHGFYWQDSTAHKEKYFAQHASFMQDNNVPVTIDPLERCGLLFAGANTALKGHSERLGDNVQDGVLTAKEISLMDLRDADLVVLSACESGLGDITGDGVFGLQRAFKMAGAQTIIMSLWKVDDSATQLLMTEFYKNWIMSKGKMSKRDAFRKAQSIVRSQYNDPKDWAGFILLD